MTLSEIFGDEALALTEQEREFLDVAKTLWASQLRGLVLENKKAVSE
jgi:hypothetical protein